MNRTFSVLMLIVLLAGCSGLPSVNIPFLQTPAPASSPQPTATPFSLEATHTPDLFVINTAAATNTLGAGTGLPTNTLLPTSTITMPVTITLDPVDPSLFTPSPSVFISVQRSTGQLVWGSTCEGAREITFKTQVRPVKRLRFVTLWYRLQDKYSGRHTEWGGGAIFSDNDQGTYFYTIELSQISGYRFYEDAWFQYQLVASTITQKVLGSTIVSRNEVSLTHCKVLVP